LETIIMETTQTMNATRSHHRGGSETLVYEPVARPVPDSGEVLVEVHAAAITPTELTWDPRRSVDHLHAAAIPLSALTAWQAFRTDAFLRAGQRALIHGGAGGVGSFAIQLAKHFGAETIATCSARNADFVKSLGALIPFSNTIADPSRKTSRTSTWSSTRSVARRLTVRGESFDAEAR
jgi:NADPH:quinone reductase-like Zn-dependent oxidoreductase